MSRFGQNFLPGPTDVHPDVLAVLNQPMFGHRSPRMQAMLAAMQPALQECFGTRQPVFIATSSATGLPASTPCCAPRAMNRRCADGSRLE